MKTILGLDLGTTSIGWAVVNEAETKDEKSSIVDLGVRLVPLTVDEQSHFNNMSGETANQKRSLQRGMRRNLQRYKLRRSALIEVLKYKCFISDETKLYEAGNRSTFETYRLRAKAVTEEITLEELSRVLLMLNKKRGYKSSRKGNTKESGKVISGIDTSKQLLEENITPGELSYKILRSGGNKLPEFYQSDLQKEIDIIWAKQSEYYPQLTSGLRESINGKTKSQTWSVLSKALEVKGSSRTLKGKELRLENYRLRSGAVHNQITLEEMVVVLQEINGEISNLSGYLSEIGEHSKSLYFNNQTIGQYLMASIAKDPNKSLKNIVFYRQDHIAEFDAIWENQRQYHKKLTDELKEEIRDIIIYYQRPLKSKKSLVSVCELEQKEIEIEKNGKTITKVVGNKVIPRSSLLFQEFKVWQTLNNVVVSLKGVTRKVKKQESLDFGEDELYVNGSRSLTKEEKKILAEELQVKEKLTKAEVISLLFGTAKKLDLNYKTIDGNKTMSQLYDAYSKILDLSGHIALNFNESAKQIKKQAHEEFEALGWNASVLDFESANEALDSQQSYRLWHLLYSYTDDSSKSDSNNLIDHISELTGIDKEYCDVLTEIAFTDDYGNLCAKAIKKLLPHLKEGKRYDEACVASGYRHSKSSLTKEEIDNKELKRHLEILPKNSLRNPIVEKILNQMSNVVNSLVDEYGAFDEIRVELARELKKGAKERKEMNDSINATTRENEGIKQILKDEFNIAYPSRNDIVRYKLYEELKPIGYHTLYSNKYIRKEQLFSKDIDIEHIIPQARILDDSISNKTLEFRDVNIEKGNSTAYDYVKGKYGEDKLDDYAKRCDECFKNKKGKLRKLMMSENEIPKDFVDRDIRNTQYISKKALSMLSGITRRVVATSGTITAKLREDWQLIDVMKEINWNKYESLGLVEYHTNREGKQIGQITDWSKRNDNRHHAMDALTVAFTRDVYIQYFNNKNASEKPNSNEYAIRNKYVKEGKILAPMPLNEFRAEAQKHLENILVSYKAKNKVVTKNVNKIRVGSEVKEKVQLTPRGQLHNETIYGSHYEYECKEEKVGSAFNEEKILTVSKGAYRDALLKRLNECGGDAKEAFTGRNSLDKRPIWIDENHSQAVPLRVKTVELVRKYTVRKAIDEYLKGKKPAEKEKAAKTFISQIVDVKTRHIFEERLKQYGSANEAFSNLEQNPIWQNEEKGIKIKKVTLSAIESGLPLHEKRDRNGIILNEHLPIDFVNTGNNHHIAIYSKPKLDSSGIQKYDADGNAMTELAEVVVSLYEAVARAIQGMPIVDKEYKQSEGWKFLYSMKQNECFVFPNEATGFNPREIDLLDSKNRALISPNLYRVQKLTSKDYFFRHHLETNVENNKELQGITWKRISSLGNMDKLVKVRVNHLGQIVEVGEY